MGKEQGCIERAFVRGEKSIEKTLQALRCASRKGGMNGFKELGTIGHEFYARINTSVISLIRNEIRNPSSPISQWCWRVRLLQLDEIPGCIDWVLTRCEKPWTKEGISMDEAKKRLQEWRDMEPPTEYDPSQSTFVEKYLQKLEQRPGKKRTAPKKNTPSTKRSRKSLAKQNDPRQNDILERMATLEREIKELRRRDSVEDQPQEDIKSEQVQEQPQEIKSVNTQILNEALVKARIETLLKPGDSWNPCDADNRSIMSEEEVEFPGCSTSATALVEIDQGLEKKYSTTRDSWDPQDWDIMSVEEVATQEQTASTQAAVEKIMPPVQEVVTPEPSTTQQVEKESGIGREDTMFLQQSFGDSRKLTSGQLFTPAAVPHPLQTFHDSNSESSDEESMEGQNLATRLRHAFENPND